MVMMSSINTSLKRWLIDLFETHLKLYSFNESLYNNQILNLNQVKDTFTIEIPRDIAKYLVLTSIYEMQSGTDSVELDIVPDRSHMLPWLQIQSTSMNLEPGMHNYQFNFTHTQFNTNVSLYLTYCIQTDNPDTSSYIYMDRSESNES